MDIFKRGQNGLSGSRHGSFDDSSARASSLSRLPPAPRADMPSPPDRHLREPAGSRRPSVFTLRSRSNTANSLPPRPSDNQDQPESTAAIPEPPPVPKQKPASSMFAVRGRKLRRQSGKFASAVPDVEELGAVRKSSVSVFGKERKRSTYETLEQYSLRMRHISQPFDFEHRTHTESQHVQQALQTSQNELMAEFWAQRASQMPQPELRGIKVDDLNHLSCSRHLSTDGGTSPPPPPPPPPHTKPVCHKRSVGSFSRSILPTSPHQSAASGENAPSHRTRSPPSLEDNRIAQALPLDCTVSVDWNQDIPFHPHAVTTPDESARLVTSSPWDAELAHIAEEEDGYFGRKSYDQGRARSPSPDLSPTQTPVDPSPDFFSPSDQIGPHEHLASFAHHRSTKPRSLSQASDTLGAPFSPSGLAKKTIAAGSTLQRCAKVKRRSTVFVGLSDADSWEDDIDYCYDIGADADCDFEWGRVSNAAQGNLSITSTPLPFCTSTAVEEDEDEGRQTAVCGSRANSKQGGMSSDSPSLSFECHSAVSASTNSLLTPVDTCAANSSHGPSAIVYQSFTDHDSYTPSLLVPQDFKDQLSKEDVYDDEFFENFKFGAHHTCTMMDPRTDNTLSIADSLRSGPERDSMTSSYESSLCSASVSLTSSARRSHGSAGSVPDLVHSHRIPRPTAESPANRASADEDDCDGSSISFEASFAKVLPDGAYECAQGGDKTNGCPTVYNRTPNAPSRERSVSDSVPGLSYRARVQARHAHAASTTATTMRKGSKGLSLSLFPQPSKGLVPM